MAQSGVTMTIAEDLRVAHSNAVTWNINYPEGVDFAERHVHAAEQTRIPTARYTSPEFLREELAGVWNRTWQMACRSEDLPAPGDHVAYTIADQEWLVVR